MAACHVMKTLFSVWFLEYAHISLLVEITIPAGRRIFTPIDFQSW
jgi:hypothetical protein